ncbi:MAG: hypothetical protein ACOX7Y_07630 [Methanosarcina sp.]|jgi:hypothetical protein
MQIDNINYFENKVEFIFYHIKKYGIDSVHIDFDTTDTLKVVEFIKKVHEGWKIAQDNIVDELILIEEIRKENKKKLTEAHRKKDEILKQKYFKENENLDFNEHILRKLADSIAWQILRENHIVRRFCTSDKLQTIQPSNLRREKKFVDSYNESNPLSFALLSDITSFIQIGDALIFNYEDNTRIVVELKDGETNETVRKAIDNYYQTGRCDKYLRFFKEEHGKKALEQLERMMKQDLKGSRLAHVLNEGEGVDPIGDRIKIPDPVFPTKHFKEHIIKLLNEVDTVNYSLDCIDSCLHICAYSSKYPCPQVFELLMKGQGNSYPICDFRSILFQPVVIPPFMLPLPKEQIFDLIFGRKLILFCLNFDEWMKLGEEFELNIEWVSRKKSSRINQKHHPIHRPFEFNNRIIQVSHGEHSFYLGGGQLTRIFYEFVYPSSILAINRMSFDHKPE